MKIQEEYISKMFNIAINVPGANILVVDKDVKSLYDNYLGVDGVINKYLKEHDFKGIKVNHSFRQVRFPNKSIIWFVPLKTEHQLWAIAGWCITACFMYNPHEIPADHKLFLRTKLRLGELTIPTDNKYYNILPTCFVENSKELTFVSRLDLI